MLWDAPPMLIAYGQIEANMTRHSAWARSAHRTVDAAAGA